MPSAKGEMQSTVKPTGILSAGGVLDRIVEAKIPRVADLKTRHPLSELVSKASERPAGPSFIHALSKPNRVNVISEIKHRSPSKGVIREEINPVGVGVSYEKGGAAALSILTEEDFFGGSLDHLRAVREKVGLPILRKDFVFDSYQVHEARAAGADAVLLIVAILDDGLLADLIALASDLRIDALVEVHTAGEMDRASRAGARLIGVNNRDLSTFNVDLETSERLAPLAPRDAVLVAESGVNTGQDIRRLRQSGYGAFLVGERLMRAADPGVALQSLITEAEN